MINFNSTLFDRFFFYFFFTFLVSEKWDLLYNRDYLVNTYFLKYNLDSAYLSYYFVCGLVQIFFLLDVINL